MNLIPMEGKRFGRWTVLRRGKTDRRKRIYWVCKCDCGTEREVEGTGLRTGDSKSCSCFSIEETIKREITHGMTKTPLYRLWRSMITRCYNSNALCYDYYGGRGIKVCERWHDFKKFYDDMHPRPSSDHSIDRIDNDGNYGPDNCKWSTRQEQMSNRRGCIYLDTPKGRMTVAEAAREAGVCWGAMRNRVKRNIPHDRILDPNIRL